MTLWLMVLANDAAFETGVVVGRLLEVGVVVGGGVWLLVWFLRRQSRAGGAARQAPRFSEDGRWWWDGVAWRPAISEDGLWRWDGARWVRAEGDTVSRR